MVLAFIFAVILTFILKKLYGLFAIMGDTLYLGTPEDAELAMYFQGGKEKQPTMDAKSMSCATCMFVPIDPYVVKDGPFLEDGSIIIRPQVRVKYVDDMWKRMEKLALRAI